MWIFKWRLDGFSPKYISLYLYLGLFRKPEKLGFHTGSKWWPGDPDVKDDPNDPLTRWPNDPVPCLDDTTATGKIHGKFLAWSLHTSFLRCKQFSAPSGGEILLFRRTVCWIWLLYYALSDGNFGLTLVTSPSVLSKTGATKNSQIRYGTTTTTTTALRSLYRQTCVSRHLQLRTRGFYRCNVLLSACPCWRQPAHSDSEEDAGFLFNMVSVPHSVYRRRRLIGSGPFWGPNFAAIRAIKSHLNPVNNHFFRSANNKGDCSSELPMRCVRQRLNTARNSERKKNRNFTATPVSQNTAPSQMMEL